MTKRPPRVGFVSLGCPKALVDSERIVTELRAEGYLISSTYKDSDLVIVNTCGFIDAAVQESLEAISEALNENGKVIVTGCLGGKNTDEGNFVALRFPKLLGVTGPEQTEEVLRLVHENLLRPHEPFGDLVPAGGVLLTPKHYAYLKIAEGCNHHCTFCIIPSLRGPLVSRPIGSVIREASNLVKSGVKELLVIAQDTAAYGQDVKYKLEFLAMLQELTRKKKLGVLMSLHELDLAERVSDWIVCVKGDTVEYYGTPEEVFVDGFVNELYGITDGTFCEKDGSVELKKCEGMPEVFVIAGNGTGSFCFRKLQRKGIPFSVGILGKQDQDYRTAAALAVHVIAGEAYEDFTEEQYRQAREEMLSCGKVICCQNVFRRQNLYNKQLLEEAKKAGMEIEQWQK